MMKKILCKSLLLTIVFFVACTTDAGYDPSSRYEDKKVDYIVERSYHVPKCDKESEGDVIYLVEDMMTYACIDGLWTVGRKLPEGALELEDLPRASSSGTLPKEIKKESEISYETSSFVDSRDGHEYRTVIIDGMEWMAENLDYDDGEYNLVMPSCTELFEKRNCRMYLGYTRESGYQMAASQVCPDDFEIPSEYRWERFFEAVGDDDVAKILKDKSFSVNKDYPAKDLISFSVLATGYYSFWEYAIDGDTLIENDVGKSAVFWTSSKNAFEFRLNQNEPVLVNRYGYASVRCMRLL